MAAAVPVVLCCKRRCISETRLSGAEAIRKGGGETAHQIAFSISLTTSRGSVNLK